MASGDRRPVYKGNRRGMILIAAVVLILLAIFSVKCKRLAYKNEAYAQQVEELQQEITEEEGRTESIEELRDYTKSDAYVEKIAREKLGLVYPDEVIFKPES